MLGRTMSHPRGIPDFIHSLDPSSYRLVTTCCTLKAATCRVRASRRPSTLVPYVNSNFHFVYNNCAQLGAAKQIEDLNDVLFSHCFFRETGVQWNLLFCVMAWKPSDFVCPICLDVPVAPRITRCGHIFCADCMKALFELSASHRCPVCYEALVQSEITRCVLRTYNNESEKLRFVKLTRKGGLCVCSRGPISELKFASDYDSAYTRFSIADSQFIADVYQSELNALETQLEVYKESKVEDRIAYVKDIEKSITSDVVKQDDTKFVLGSSFGSDLLFYQCEDGRLIFLDNINVEMLIEQFGSIEEAPDLIEAKILNTEVVNIDERTCPDRAEFDHLPMGAEIKIVLVDLKDIVDEKVMNKFNFRIKRKTAVKKTKEPVEKNTTGRVITKADYQTFVAVEHKEEEINLRDEAQFPSWLPTKQTRKPKNPVMEVTEDYPELLPRATKKKVHMKEFYKPPEPVKPEENAFPTLSGRPEVLIQKPKKKSVWTNLKL